MSEALLKMGARTWSKRDAPRRQRVLVVWATLAVNDLFRC
jgi:hypothetical protein